MRKFAIVILLFFSVLTSYASANPFFVFSGKSYIQRGVLTVNEQEIAFTVYVVSTAEKIKMIMETQAGRMARIELDSYGKVIVCEGGKLFPKRFVESFVLPNFRAIMGFTKYLDNAFVYLKNASVCEIEHNCTLIKFEEMSVNNSAQALPKIEIISQKYKAEFNFVSQISNK